MNRWVSKQGNSRICNNYKRRDAETSCPPKILLIILIGSHRHLRSNKNNVKKRIEGKDAYAPTPCSQ